MGRAIGAATLGTAIAGCGDAAPSASLSAGSPPLPKYPRGQPLPPPGPRSTPSRPPHHPPHHPRHAAATPIAPWAMQTWKAHSRRHRPSCARRAEAPACVLPPGPSGRGPACSCFWESGGRDDIGPVGLGCSRLSRTGECLLDPSEFPSCGGSDANACDRVCDALEQRLATDAARSIDIERLGSVCAKGQCFDACERTTAARSSPDYLAESCEA